MGRVRDEQGRPLAGLTVVVSRAGHVVARVRTGELGEYRVTGLVGGVYCVRAGSSVTIGRLWTTASAPPRSRHRLDLAADPAEENSLLTSSPETYRRMRAVLDGLLEGARFP